VCAAGCARACFACGRRAARGGEDALGVQGERVGVFADWPLQGGCMAGAPSCRMARMVVRRAAAEDEEVPAVDDDVFRSRPSESGVPAGPCMRPGAYGGVGNPSLMC